ncbi:MAG: carbohydrate-binding domain-containing protein [Eubacteriales bacterium]|nr:carbohydrate-binding domain-containing protein [Eubacteriales bacterium]
MHWSGKIWMGTTVMALLMSQGTLASERVNDTEETLIMLSDDGVKVNDESASEERGDTVYLSHDIIYYEERETYDSGNPYGEGEVDDQHSESEADAHTVVNITQPGTYRITGTLSQGQIAVDLGEEAKTDPEAVVTLILENADITCTVAPAVIFYNTYECDTQWVEYDEGDVSDYEAKAEQDTSQAGANVIIADGSVNNINGSYVARIYEDSEEEKKKHKYDGAFYSKMSMNVDGEETGDGVLNIVADNEGLDSELHLTVNGGKVNIQSQDDGINTNEDGVSVTTINGGAVHITAGLGKEGDGIDSNGYLVINGGTVIATANPASDSGLDSDSGSYINGGTVIATGSTMDWPESDSDQVTINLQFAQMQAADEALIVTDTEGSVLFAYDPDKDETTGENNRDYQGAVISSPSFKTGEDYHIYVGGDVIGEETDGLYDADTVTGMEGSVQQEYSGSDIGRSGGPEGFGGQRIEGGMMQIMQLFSVDGIAVEVSDEAAETILQMMENQNFSGDITAEEIKACTTLQELSELLYGENKFEDRDMSGAGEGFRPSDGEMPRTPDEKPQEGKAENPAMPDEKPQETTEGGDQSSAEFHMTDKVNAFANVKDSGM